MKKLSVLFLATILVLFLASCGTTEAATAADEAISAIGEVTLDSLPAIEAAEGAVEALTEEERGQIDNLDVLNTARETYDRLVTEAEAAAVDEVIAAIGPVTEDSAAAISAARAAYDEASPDVQALVTGLAELDAAEAEYLELCAGQVSDMIAALGDITLDDAVAIRDTLSAYESLTPEAAELVEGVDALEAAEAAVKELALQVIGAMRVDEDVVRGLNFYYPTGWVYYDANTWAADQRSFALPYLGEQGGRYWMRVVFNYTGNSWVFFENLLVSIDGELTTKSFDYFDVTRDNGGGRVWEYVDVDATDNSYMDLMWEIANSDTTIIRFQGESYSSDLTVTDTDKAAMRDIYLAYTALTL